MSFQFFLCQFFTMVPIFCQRIAAIFNTLTLAQIFTVALFLFCFPLLFILLAFLCIIYLLGFFFVDFIHRLLSLEVVGKFWIFGINTKAFLTLFFFK